MKHARPGAVLMLLLLLPATILGQEGGIDGVVLIAGHPAEGVVLYLESERAAAEPTPSVDTTVIDQSRLRFLPPVVVGRPGLTVHFLNSDPILHNVFSPGGDGEAFDLGTYPSNTSRTHTFTKPGFHVILCHVHPEMFAYVVVVTTPYHAVTDTGGLFRIPDVPPGSYHVNVWRRGSEPRHETLVVPAAGARGLVLNLSRPGRLVETTSP